MRRLTGGFRQTHQRNKRLLQNIFRFTVTQSQSPTIEQQLNRLLVVKRLAPVRLWLSVHGL